MFFDNIFYEVLLQDGRGYSQKYLIVHNLFVV